MIVDENENVTIISNEVETSDSGFGKATLDLYKVSQFGDLSVDNLTYNEYSMNGEHLHVLCDLTNNGTKTITGIKAKFLDADGKEIFETAQVLQILPGETVPCTIAAPISESSEVTVQVDAVNFEDAIRVSWAGVDSVTEKGEVCKVIFKAKEGYTGNVAFEIKDVKLYDENGDALVVQTERAEFAIESIDGKTPHISIETVKYENEGFLSVSISENSLLCGGGIEVKYDNTLVDITNAEAGVVLNGKSPVINTEYGENIIKLSWASALPMTESGELMKIYFTIKEEVRGFVTFELNAQTLYNDKTENVVATYTNGGVTIDRAPIAKKGDVYTDEAINSKDAIKLAQYLARWEVELSDESKYAADVFSDELINSKDAIKLAQYLARWDVTLE